MLPAHSGCTRSHSSHTTKDLHPTWPLRPSPGGFVIYFEFCSSRGWEVVVPDPGVWPPMISCVGPWEEGPEQ